LFADTTETLFGTLVIGPEADTANGPPMGRISDHRLSEIPADVTDNLYKDRQSGAENYVSFLESASFDSTYASGSNIITVYGATQFTNHVLYTVVGAATTVALPLTSAHLGPIVSNPGERLVVRITGSAAYSAPDHYVNGGYGVVNNTR
ncbi:unnamed protein product, partial [marine sediment metagenome]